MADSVYISEHLNKPQLEFLKLLDDYEIQLFKFTEIEQLLGQKFDNLSEILENLVDKQLLVRYHLRLSYTDQSNCVRQCLFCP